MATKQLPPQHAEVLAALQAIGNAERGRAIQLDRASALPHLGIGFPALRLRVKAGFSFSKQPLPEQLPIWDALWQHSPYGDVLFAALEFLAPIVRKPLDATLALRIWGVTRHWIGRVDNWCHADALSAVYSRLLQAQFEAVYPQLQAWNAQDEPLWLRRISITSLVHYTGKNAVFLDAAVMQPLLQRCVADHRQPVQLALGWVLRELSRANPKAGKNFLQKNAAAMTTAAVRRARG